MEKQKIAIACTSYIGLSSSILLLQYNKLVVLDSISKKDDQ